MNFQRARLCLWMVMLANVGCVSTKQGREQTASPAPTSSSTTEIQLSDYALPFGHPPDKPDLEAAFLSLPDALAADMPVKMREDYVADYSRQAMGYMFDAKHQFAEYYNDNAYNPIRPSSIFYLKIIPSVKYGYVFVVSMLKTFSAVHGAGARNFFVLAPSRAGWVDITTQVLPSEVQRNWYVQAERRTTVLEAGPPERRADGDWGMGTRTFDLVWKKEQFVAQPAKSSEYTTDI